MNAARTEDRPSCSALRELAWSFVTAAVGIVLVGCTDRSAASVRTLTETALLVPERAQTGDQQSAIESEANADRREAADTSTVSHEGAATTSVDPEWMTEGRALVVARNLLDRKAELWVAAGAFHEHLPGMFQIAESPGGAPSPNLGIEWRGLHAPHGTVLTIFHRDMEPEDSRNVRPVGEPEIRAGIRWYRLEWLE